MGNFNRGDRHGGDDRRGGGGFRGGRGFGGGRKFGGSAPFGGRQAMFQAVCDKCHKNCEVPFKPKGDRPIFCDECFKMSRGRNEGEGFSRPADLGRSNFGEEQRQRIGRSQNFDQLLGSFEVLNVKLDKIIKLLAPVSEEKIEEKPTQTEEITKDKKTKVKEVKVKKVVKKTVAKKKK